MFYYSYNEKTKEYTKKEIAQLDPLESELQEKDIFLLPANATFIAPPEQKEGYAIIWNNNAWEYIEDNRNKTYYLPTDNHYSLGNEMKELGPLPEGASLAKPEITFEELKEEKLNSARYELSKKLKEYSDYPEEESNTFFIQEKEARAYIENNNIPKEEIPLITNISICSNTNLLDLSEKIIKHADTFTQIKGFYLGKHKKARDMIYNAKTKEELESINIEAIFNEEI